MKRVKKILLITIFIMVSIIVFHSQSILGRQVVQSQSLVSENDFINLIHEGLREAASRVQDMKGKINFETRIWSYPEGRCYERKGTATFLKKGCKRYDNLRLRTKYSYKQVDNAGKIEQIAREVDETNVYIGNRIYTCDALGYVTIREQPADFKEEPLINPLTLSGFINEELIALFENRKAQGRVKFLGLDTVNNIPCHVIRLYHTSPETSHVCYADWWIASQNGFITLKRQVVNIWGTETVTTYEFTIQPKQYTGGFWAAATATSKQYNIDPSAYPQLELEFKKYRKYIKAPKYNLVNEIYATFSELVFNSGITDQDLQIRIPKGALVTDEINNTIYRVGEDRYPDIFSPPTK